MELSNGVSGVAPISLDGRFVRLRPITQADYGFLWRCRSNPEIMPIWMAGRTMPSFEQYVRELETGLSGHLLTLLLIETNAETGDTPRPIGFVLAHDFSPQDRYAFFDIALAPEYTAPAWGIEAILLFLDYLFAYFDLRKVCMDVCSFNNHPVALLLRSRAPVEGRFRGQRYYQGVYHDVIRLGLLHEEWAAARQVLATLLAPPAPAQISPLGAQAASAGDAAAGGDGGAETLAELAGDLAAAPTRQSTRGKGAGARDRRARRGERHDDIHPAEAPDSR